MSKPKVLIERVNAGRYLVDCEACGTVGVWPRKADAVEAKKAHVCGDPTPVAGAWSAADRAAPLVEHLRASLPTNREAESA